MAKKCIIKWLKAEKHTKKIDRAEKHIIRYARARKHTWKERES
jgi:hypothetical protein